RRCEDGGYQVRKAFTHPCTGLDHEMAALGDGLGNSLGHFELLAARLVTGQLASDNAFGTEDGSDGHEEDYPKLGDVFIAILQHCWIARVSGSGEIIDDLRNRALGADDKETCAVMAGP